MPRFYPRWLVLPIVVVLLTGLLAILRLVGTDDVPNVVALARGPSSAPACVDDRFTQCRTSRFLWNIRESGRASGQVIGTAGGNLTISANVRTGERRWRLHYRFEVTELTQVAETGTTVTITVDCRTECTLPLATSAAPAVGAPIQKGSVVEGDVDVVSRTRTVASTFQRVDVTLSNPAAVGVGTTRNGRGTTIGPVRCDSAALTDTGDDPPLRLGPTRPGCVFPEFTPTFVINGPGSSPNLFAPRNADLVAEAQAALGGLGSPRSGPPLHREGVEAAKKRNRANACRDFVRLPDRDDSCDEYPFAGTKESATVAPFTGHVPESDNKRGGVQFSQFIASHRLFDGDAFYVEPLLGRATG